MKQGIEISVATESDIPSLCLLLELLFSQEVEFSPNREAQTRGLTRIIRDPHVGFILVAKIGGRTIGMVNILFTISTAHGSRVAILEDMVVSTAARSAGTGSILLTEAIKEAKRQGCKRITLLTDASNDAALRFYQRHGFFKSTMIPLRLNLDTGIGA